MKESSIHIVRSQAISGGTLVEALQRIRDTCKRNDFVSRTHGGIHIAPLMVRALPSLDAYRQVDSVTLRAGSRDSSECSCFVAMTRKSHDMSERHAWTTWHVAESDLALENDGVCDLTIAAGLRKEGYFCGVYVFRPSPAIDDLLRRAALFRTVITEIGLADKIRVLMDGDILRMEAHESWNLSFPSARTDGGNPSGFYASGFADVGEAVSAGEGLVERFAKRVLGFSFVAKLNSNGYLSVYHEFNSLWDLWDVDVTGAFTQEAVNILKGGELANNSPSRIPAFEWHGNKDWAAFGSVVIENGQRFLEIAADGTTAETFQDRLAFLADLKFERA